MQNVTALLLMVLTSTLVWSSNTVAAIGDGPYTSNHSTTITNESPANEEGAEEGGESDDCD